MDQQVEAAMDRLMADANLIDIARPGAYDDLDLVHAELATWRGLGVSPTTARLCVEAVNAWRVWELAYFDPSTPAEGVRALNERRKQAMSNAARARLAALVGEGGE